MRRTVTPEIVLACIKRLTAKTVVVKTVTKEAGVSPTVRELAACLDTSIGTVQVRLHQLQDEGLISIQPGKDRSIEILEGNHGKNS